MVTAIIAAAGQGKRMAAEGNKVFLALAAKPILLHSVAVFSACEQVEKIIVVAAQDEMNQVTTLLQTAKCCKPYRVVAGGSERQYSIANALAEVCGEDDDLVLVHDAARPLVTAGVIQEAIETARDYQAVGVAVPVKDTIKIVDTNGFVASTPNRNTLWAIQTPQVFTAGLLRRAYQNAAQEGFVGTDDACLVERLGVPVKIVQGSYDNIKITTPEDLQIAAALLQERNDFGMVRFGIGYDVHKLVENRKLILGGVDIPYEQGLLGHSDADVLVHSIMDALLGAAALGDIGRHFPDSDPAYKGVPSTYLLGRVKEILTENGFSVNNIDATIVAQKPKLAAYIEQMNSNIAGVLDIGKHNVNIKATTTEGLGFAGRKEGIAAYAVASVVRK